MLHNQTIKNQQLTNMNLARCAFCNSPSHTTSNCNSNMKGRREILSNIGGTFMLDDVLPDFKSFPINELRFIASIYENFQKTPSRRNMRTHLLGGCGYFDGTDTIDYLYSPIPITLTKSRMIRELVRRWTMYTQVRINYNHEKPEDGDCPICMDCMSTHIWDPTRLNWDKIATKSVLPGALFLGNIRTQCGHTFCGGCWELHVKANSKPEYHDNRFNQELTGRSYIQCPMCRHRMYYIK